MVSERFFGVQGAPSEKSQRTSTESAAGAGGSVMPRAFAALSKTGVPDPSPHPVSATMSSPERRSRVFLRKMGAARFMLFSFGPNDGAGSSEKHRVDRNGLVRVEPRYHSATNLAENCRMSTMNCRAATMGLALGP
jgi:hypothetical protein